jgi:hypothetical protein
MHVRQNINRLLRRSHYQIVKMFDAAEAVDVPAEALLDDRVLGSRIAPGRKHAWIIAAPKTGSTWLSVLLEKLLAWRTVTLTSGCSLRREQEPDIRQMVRFPGKNILSPHLHCRASESTVKFINQFHIKPIVQVRNVYDTMVSFRDHCLKGGLAVPMAYIDEEFLRYNQEKQFQFLIDLVLPWYLNFYASWFQVEGLSGNNLFFVNYDELRLDTKKVLVNILDYLGESRTDTEINQAIKEAGGTNTLKNKAVPGRGQLLLTERQRERIRELRGYYPHIDFSMVGL